MSEAGSEPALQNAAAHDRRPRQSSVVERLSRYGMQVMPAAFQRRSRLQRQQEVWDGSAPESVAQSVRKKYLKELLSQSSNSGFGSVLHLCQAPSGPAPPPDTEWALYPMEHAWMLSAVEGNYETILDFLSEDPLLLTRRDFISGYSVLHWLAKSGRDETLLKLLRFAASADIPVNVNLRGSGGLTPLHVASMHRQYPVVKLLVGAFGADADAMDYNGRRPWQYLEEGAPLEMKELLGTWDDEHTCASALNGNKNNNCACVLSTDLGEEPESAEAEEAIQGKAKRSSVRFGSLRRIMSRVSSLGNKA